MRQKTDFASRLNLMRPLARSFEKIPLRRRANQWPSFARPAPIRGAARDRHGRWERDAMGVLARETSVAGAYGKIVWS